MTRQVPHGPDDLDCPWHQKPMSEVCHKCPLWVYVLGKDPQTKAERQQWDCAMAWMPLLLIENSQRQMQTGAAVNEMTSETKLTREELRRGREEHHDAMMGSLLTIVNRVAAPQRHEAPGALQNGSAGRMIAHQETE